MAAAHSARVCRAFGATVRRFRLARGLTQEALAEQAELHRTYVADIERGSRNVSLVNIERIARGLHVALPELMSEVQSTLDGEQRG